MEKVQFKDWMSLHQGQLRLQNQKYYRINGGSVQNKGVMPHIVLPTTWDIESVGESSYPTSLPWDTIKPFKYKPLKSIFQKLIQYIKIIKSEKTLNPTFSFY